MDSTSSPRSALVEFLIIIDKLAISLDILGQGIRAEAINIY